MKLLCRDLSNLQVSSLINNYATISILKAIIPDGVGHGDSFMVDIPMDPYDEKSPEPPLEDITPYSLTPLKKSEVEHDHHPSLNGNDVKDNFHRLNPPPYTPSQTATSARPKVMLVQVPPGLLPGTILNVQVPNENRLIPAQVPPGNVREFHVAYDYQDSASNIIVSGQPVQQSDTTSKRSNDNGHIKSKKISPVIETNPWRSNPQSRQNRHYQSSRDEHDANDVGLGFVGPVLAGAAMLGTAGYMVHHHNDAE